jgi:hypothetical protein
VKGSAPSGQELLRAGRTSKLPKTRPCRQSTRNNKDACGTAALLSCASDFDVVITPRDRPVGTGWASATPIPTLGGCADAIVVGYCDESSRLVWSPGSMRRHGLGQEVDGHSNFRGAVPESRVGPLPALSRPTVESCDIGPGGWGARSGQCQNGARRRPVAPG